MSFVLVDATAALGTALLTAAVARRRFAMISEHKNNNNNENTVEKRVVLFTCKTFGIFVALSLFS